ncbi:MAG: hypothetical protein ACKO0M_02165 [Cyanobium sp.]
MSPVLAPLLLLALAPTAEVSSPAPLIPGGLYQGNAPLERVVFERTLYAGECPGMTIDLPSEITLRTDQPPCERCRVRLTNTLTGGYSDREYSPGRIGSERFTIGLGNRHHQQFLSVEEGSNPIAFVIRQEQKILGEGAFLLDAVVHTQRLERAFSGRILDTFCDDERTWSLQRRSPLAQCRDVIVTQLRGLCPDGTERVVLETRQTVWRRH